MAEWDAAFINDLPDSAFAVVLAGGEKDSDGKTVPRDLRKLPHHGADGALDMPHLRNAMSREPQADMPADAHERARSHLQAHMDSTAPERSGGFGWSGEERYIDTDGELQVRSAARREVDIRIMPWNRVISHQFGPEMFERGAFAGTDASRVLLKAPDTEGRHKGPVCGAGMALEERDDGAYMTFKVSRTQPGDELLALAADKVVKGASVGFNEVEGGTAIETREGRRLRVHRRVALEHVATTWRPAYAEAEVVAMRSAQAEGEAPMAEVQDTTAVETATPATPDLSPFTDRIAETLEKFGDRIARIEERSRMDIVIPGRSEPKDKPKLHHWAETVVRLLTGERVSPRLIQERALDDVLVTDNPGVVPDAFVNDLIGIMDARRPFLDSTERIPTPDTGMSIVVPVLNQHSTADVQNPEKTEIESTAMKVTTADFPAITIAGGADVSIQMLKRATSSFLDLLMRDLARAYALKADSEALAALFDAGTTPGSANLDPESLTIGEAWANSISAVGTPPDTIWMSSDGVASFIDAKNDGTNAPLYFNLNANFTVGGGPGGNVSALRPVYTPALDGTGVDVMIGPRTGFAWAEDGTFQLAVDNPTLAGRDIAIVGILFFIPRYPTAFTTYNIAS